MKRIPTNPFKPCVRSEHIFAFDPERPETFTPSPLMNAVLTAMKRERLTQQNEVARHLEVDYIQLAGAVRIITGMTFNQMRDKLLRHMARQLQEENPDWTKKDVAKALGYKDASSLWRLFHRDYDHNYYKKWHDRMMRRQTEWTY